MEFTEVGPYGPKSTTTTYISFPFWSAPCNSNSVMTIKEVKPKPIFDSTIITGLLTAEDAEDAKGAQRLKANGV